MKALTIKQPWAWAMLHGKDIENRTWVTHFTGTFLIHAGKQFDHDGFQWLLDHRELLDAEIPHRDDFQFGGFIGSATIKDCVSFHKSPWFSGPVGFVLDHQQPMEFKPWKGRLGLFNVDLECHLKCPSCKRIFEYSESLGYCGLCGNETALQVVF